MKIVLSFALTLALWINFASVSFASDAYIKYSSPVELYQYELVALFLNNPYLPDGSRVKIVLSKSLSREQEYWIIDNLGLSPRSLHRTAERRNNQIHTYKYVRGQKELVDMIDDNMLHLGIVDEHLAFFKGDKVRKIKVIR